MRTTLDIDDDLLHAAKEIARHEHSSAGEVVSRLLRHALTGTGGESAAPVYSARRPTPVAGFVPFGAPPGVVVTDDQVNRLRDVEGI